MPKPDLAMNVTGAATAGDDQLHEECGIGWSDGGIDGVEEPWPASVGTQKPMKTLRRWSRRIAAYISFRE